MVVAGSSDIRRPPQVYQAQQAMDASCNVGWPGSESERYQDQGTYFGTGGGQLYAEGGTGSAGDEDGEERAGCGCVSCPRVHVQEERLSSLLHQVMNTPGGNGLSRLQW